MGDFHRERCKTGMDWPTHFLDLNPIGQLWDILQRRMSARAIRPQTRQEWAIIPRLQIRKLIRSFKSRCRAVIEAHGVYTRYKRLFMCDFILL